MGPEMLSGIGSGLGIGSSIGGGIAGFGQMRALADMREDEADLLQRFGREAEADELRAGTRLTGRQRGRAAASGVDVGSGSVLNAIQQGVTATNRNAFRARQRFERAAIARETEARAARRASLLSLFSGLTQGGTQALGLLGGGETGDGLLGPLEGVDDGGDVFIGAPPTRSTQDFGGLA